MYPAAAWFLASCLLLAILSGLGACALRIAPNGNVMHCKEDKGCKPIILRFTKHF